MLFKDVIGHTYPLRILRNALAERRSGISYLFYGPSGIGKSFVARQFAKAINCESQDGDCAGACSACRRADNLGYPDLHWLDLEGDSANIKIEQVRAMQNALNLRPFEGRVKVFAINNCQSLTEEAANCLLKVIEEPPLDTVIILITANIRLLLPTIVSRCQKIRFLNLRRKTVEEILSTKQGLDHRMSHYLAHFTDGRIGNALVLARSGFLARKDSIVDLFLHNSNYADIGGLFKDKDGAQEVLSILLGWFRDVLLVKAGCAGTESLINQDRIAKIQSQARHYSYQQLFLCANVVAKSFEYLKQNINLRLIADNLTCVVYT
jgi:DNA polymerase-3 subunit delta'